MERYCTLPPFPSPPSWLSRSDEVEEPCSGGAVDRKGFCVNGSLSSFFLIAGFAQYREIPGERQERDTQALFFLFFPLFFRDVLRWKKKLMGTGIVVPY